MSPSKGMKIHTEKVSFTEQRALAGSVISDPTVTSEPEVHSSPQILRRALSVEIWSVQKLVPYIRNPRRNDDAVERMAASIQEFGFKIPILARSDGVFDN